MQRLLSVPSRRKPQTKAKQRKTKRKKPPSRERKVYAPKGRFFTLLRGLSVDFTPTQLLSIKRFFFKRRYILESFNEIHCAGGKPSFLPLFLKVRTRISTQMRQSALLYRSPRLPPPLFFLTNLFILFKQEHKHW